MEAGFEHKYGIFHLRFPQTVTVKIFDYLCVCSLTPVEEKNFSRIHKLLSDVFVTSLQIHDGTNFGLGMWGIEFENYSK